ncbi:MAG: hypothetical protein LBM93_12065, partial [Oscillospiraceae bacterium]|nr:hypothetical protein [Oscillospiraceae bacterium]
MKYIKRELANERYLVADTDTGVEEIFTKSALQQYVEGGVEVLGCNLNTGNIYPLFWKKNGESVSKDDFLYLGEWRKEHSNSDSYTRLTGKIYPKGSLGVSAGRKYTFAVSKGLQTELNGENLRFGGTFIETYEGLITEIYKNSEIEVRYKRNFNDIIADIKAGRTILQQEVEIFLNYDKGKFKKVCNLEDIACEVYNFTPGYAEEFNKFDGYAGISY